MCCNTTSFHFFDGVVCNEIVLNCSPLASLVQWSMLVRWFVPWFLFLFDWTLQSWGPGVAFGPLHGCSMVCSSSTLQVVGPVVEVCSFWGLALVIRRWRVSFCAIISLLFFNGGSPSLKILLQKKFLCALNLCSWKPCVFICQLPHPYLFQKLQCRGGFKKYFGAITRGTIWRGVDAGNASIMWVVKLRSIVSSVLSFLFCRNFFGCEKLVGCTPWIDSNWSFFSVNLWCYLFVLFLLFGSFSSVGLFSCHLLWVLGGIEVEKKKVERYIRGLVPYFSFLYYFATS